MPWWTYSKPTVYESFKSFGVIDLVYMISGASKLSLDWFMSEISFRSKLCEGLMSTSEIDWDLFSARRVDVLCPRFLSTFYEKSSIGTINCYARFFYSSALFTLLWNILSTFKFLTCCMNIRCSVVDQRATLLFLVGEVATLLDGYDNFILFYY